MTSVQEVPFAETRPRIKRDVLFTETTDGVLFHDAHEGFQLAGRSAYEFASSIVPYLDGEHRVRDLVEMLPGPQEEMVASLVRMLLERGLARDIPDSGGDGRALLPAEVAAAFAAQIDYIGLYRDLPVRRFHRYRTARVAVLGDDPVAGWCATALIRTGMAAVGVNGPADVYATASTEAAELTRSGVPATVEPAGALAGYDLIVCAGRDAPARVARLMEDGLPDGQRVLPFTMCGRRAMIGPLTARGTRGCLSCAVLRLGANGDSCAAAEVWRSVSTGGHHTASRPDKHLSAMLGNLLAADVFRALTGVLPAETEGRVLLQETDSSDTAVNTLAPHPLCRFCGPAGDTDEPLELSRTPLVAPAGTAVAELDELTDALVATGTGVFREFDDDGHDGLPLKVSRLRLGTAVGKRHTITAADTHDVAGARMRALRSAAVVYLDLVVPAPVTDRTDLPKVTRLATASGAGSGEHTAWVAATAMDGPAEVLLPAGAVRPYSWANANRAFTASGAGTGIGTSPAAAAYRALLSAAGHHALLGAIRDGAPAVDLTTFGEDDELMRGASALDVEVELLVVRTGEVTVLLARTREFDGTPLWALGADLSARRAAVIAVRDLLGQVQASAQRPEEPLDLGHRVLTSFDPFTVTATGTTTLDLTAAATSAELLAALRSQGQVAYAVQDGSADLRRAGLFAVRVLLARQDG